MKESAGMDLVCYSHLRWGFVYQRPQHLMSRFARGRRVFFIEEPERADIDEATLRVQTCERSTVQIVTPLIPRETGEWRLTSIVSSLIAGLFSRHNIQEHVAWFYTPMAVEVMPPGSARLIVYDCMDELSLFHGAPPDLIEKEKALFQMCDLVFTGGVSLFEAKREQHRAVYPFPSGVDCNHFLQARARSDPQDDQRGLPHPRLGYAGVIDERIDLGLIDYIAQRRPEWQIVMLGPTAKIDRATLPRRPNIHWLGMKPYHDLPGYFSGWDVALMPFAMNDATKYISPTKTPEYLAAGLPVVSTPIRDVVRQYGRLGLARTGATPDQFLSEAELALRCGMTMKWRERADAFLHTLSWERTWESMNSLIEQRIEARLERRTTAMRAPVFIGGGA